MDKLNVYGAKVRLVQKTGIEQLMPTKMCKIFDGCHSWQQNKLNVRFSYFNGFILILFLAQKQQR